MNTSYRVCELVRSKISSEYVTASDTDISRVLGLSRTAASSYKHEKSVMSLDTLAKAQNVLQLPPQEYFDLMLTLSAEGTTNPTLQESWGKLHRLVRGALKHGGSRMSGPLSAAILAVGLTLASPVKPAYSDDLAVPYSIHYTKRRRHTARRKRSMREAVSRFLRFLFVTPVAQPSFA